MEHDDGDQPPPPQMTGVVIISFPPPDNPCQGKTITAFTLSDSPPPPPQSLPRNRQANQHPPPSNSNSDLDSGSQFRLPVNRFLPLSPRIVLGLSLAALIMWSTVVNYPGFLESRKSLDRDDDGRPTSFVLPLFPKVGGGDSNELQRELELKLGRFVGRDLSHVTKPFKAPKSISSVSVSSSMGSPLDGNVYPDALYYTHMLVGSPPKPYFLDIDTGSDLTWIQCDAPCTSCAQGPHPLYKPRTDKIVPTKDSLCKEVQRNQMTEYCDPCHQCDYKIEYADQSSSMGVLAKDELHLQMANGSLNHVNVAFGCAYDQQGLLLNSLVKTDGILGLSRANVSLPFQLASQGIINNVMGHCIATDTGGSGYMFLGDDYVPYWGMAWVPMLNSLSTNFYQAQIGRLSYGSRQLSLVGPESATGQVIFDSGSSYTYFTKKAYLELVASLKDVSGEGLVRDTSDGTLPICWRAKFPIRSVKEVRHFFKHLTFLFGRKWWPVSTKLQIPPESYLILSDTGNVCLGILDGSNVYESSIIIGDTSMRGNLFVYDNVNHRIGWGRTDCLKPRHHKYYAFF